MRDENGEPLCEGNCWPDFINSTIVYWIIDVDDEELAIEWEDAFEKAMEEERRKLVGEDEEEDEDEDGREKWKGKRKKKKKKKKNEFGVYFRSHGSYARTRDASIQRDSTLLAAGYDISYNLYAWNHYCIRVRQVWDTYVKRLLVQGKSI